MEVVCFLLKPKEYAVTPILNGKFTEKLKLSAPTTFSVPPLPTSSVKLKPEIIVERGHCLKSLRHHKINTLMPDGSLSTDLNDHLLALGYDHTTIQRGLSSILDCLAEIQQKYQNLSKIEVTDLGEQIVVEESDQTPIKTALKSKLHEIFGDHELSESIAFNLEYDERFNFSSGKIVIYSYKKGAVDLINVESKVRAWVEVSTPKDGGPAISPFITLKSDHLPNSKGLPFKYLLMKNN